MLCNKSQYVVINSHKDPVHLVKIVAWSYSSFPQTIFLFYEKSGMSYSFVYQWP